MRTALVTVVSGSVYESFASDLFSSADEFFHPTNDVSFVMLHGRDGWPEATMYRYHALCDNMPDADYVFLSDADMRFEDDVWGEILPKRGITATVHPGYVGTVEVMLPYERRSNSAAYIPPGSGGIYYCGGFVGGTRHAMMGFCASIASIIDSDQADGITPKWHDESALNRVLATNPPEVTLSPAFCHPDNDSYYTMFWPERYPRKLVALDKDETTRGDR